MTFAAHAVLGAGVHGAIAHFVGCDPTWTHIFTASGGLFGLLPDLIGAVGNLLGDDWESYNEAHELKTSNPLVYIPASLAHLALDAFVHREGSHWWPKYAPLEFVTWIIGLALLALSYGLHLSL